jgi:hypothetical protein
MIDKASAEGLSQHGPRYQWATDKGKPGGRIECFGEVLDLGADYASEGARPTPRAVLVYGPYAGRQGVSKAAQVASAAARVLNEGGGGELPQGEPIWLDQLQRVPDCRIPGISRRIAENVHLSAQMTHFEQQIKAEAGSLWEVERTLFRTADGAEYHIDVRRVK